MGHATSRPINTPLPPGALWVRHGVTLGEIPVSTNEGTLLQAFEHLKMTALEDA
jgi:hypothetical protein